MRADLVRRAPESYCDFEMLLSQWVISLLACFVSAKLVACHPYPSTSTTCGVIAEHGPFGPCTTSIKSESVTNPSIPIIITTVTTHTTKNPQQPTSLPLAKRQRSHTERSKTKLSRAELIGLIVGLSIFAIILGTGLFLWILSHFPLAQERFCACFCAVCCPWLMRRTRDFEWEWD
ncbi:hypothetical protein BJX66DRAFT_294360, partial [Aspergillus keveii]